MNRETGSVSALRSCFGCVLFCALAATLGCRTPSHDWNGTWQMNPSKSSFQGPVLTISVSSDGEYRYDDGVASFAFRCDGKHRPIGRNRTQACVKSSATTLDLTREENGVKTNAFRWELSAGAQVLTATATAFSPSGPVTTGQVVASRKSGSGDFTGQWRDQGFLQQHADMTVKVDSQSLHIGYPTAGLYIDAPLDGLETAVHGPHAVAGVTYAVRPVGRREFHFLTKHNGKVLTQASLELSNDGKVTMYSWWSPDRPADKGMLVYEKK